MPASSNLASASSGGASAGGVAAAAGSAALTDYVDSLIGEKRTKPGIGLLGELIAGPLAAGEITRREVAETIMFLLVAGH